jgi:tetratricopeptide (TPR) repeat protein
MTPVSSANPFVPNRVNRFSRISFLLAGFSAFFAATGGWAQSSALPRTATATIEGNVRDVAGQPVPDAAVSLERVNQGDPLATKTNANGKFSFSVPQEGNYTVIVEKSGFRTCVTDPIALSAGQKQQLDLLLQSLGSSPAAASATVTMDFDDKPNFTVAGVTDWSGAGGHGSDTTLRTSEAFARETLALKAGDSGENSSAVSPTKPSPEGTGMERKLRAEVAAAPENADLHRRLGDLEERLGDPLAAVREYERAATLDPSEQNYFEWGTELLLHRAVAPAVTVFRKGALAHPNSARLLVGLGAALFSAGSYDDASRELCRASDLNPGDSTPYLFLGKMDVNSPTSFPCIEGKLTRFLKSQPANALANYYFAMSLLKKVREAKSSADIQQAQTLLEKAVALDPKLGEAYSQLGTLYLAEGESAKAIAAYTKAIEATPRLSEPHYRLSQLYKRNGEKEKADQEIQLYKQVEKTEADAAERQRHEVQQFLIILKDQPAHSVPH